MSSDEPRDESLDQEESARKELEALLPESELSPPEDDSAAPSEPNAADVSEAEEAGGADGGEAPDSQDAGEPEAAADEEAGDAAGAEESDSEDAGEPEADADDEGGEDAEDEAEEAPEESLVPPDPDDGIKRRWYALHAYSGQEGNVKKNLTMHAEQAGLSDLLAGILVPMEEVAEIKSGEKKISKRKFFPGYVLIRLPEHPERNPELWHMIKETPGVSGFIGSRSVPVPLDEGEVNAILEEMRGERERPKPKVKFEQGERVKIIDGPFSNFLGNIDEINHERGTLKVMVEIFERLTSVEVEFWQVEKM